VFWRFLLEPCNLRSLQTQLFIHIVPTRVHAAALTSHLTTLTDEALDDLATADVARPDDIIHGVGRLLVLQSVKDDFNRRHGLQASASAMVPTGALEVDP
jgi:hypothetical protein